MTQTIIEGLFKYFDGCPLMANGRLNIDYLPEDTKEAGVEYGISTSPGDEVIKSYLGGGAYCRYSFTIGSVNDYGADEAQNIINSGFFEGLAAWMRAQTKLRQLPELPEGYTARSISATGFGYLYNADVGAGKYQIQCELEYYRKGD